MRYLIVACLLGLVLGCTDQEQREYSTTFGNAVNLLDEHKTLKAEADTLESLLDANRTIETLVNASKEREGRAEFTEQELALLAKVKVELQQTPEAIDMRLPLLKATKSALDDAVKLMGDLDAKLHREASTL